MQETQAHTPYFAPVDGEAGPKRALILAGGGIRVSYQAGVLRALYEAGLRFHHVDGTSGGTINTAMLLSGLSPVEMCDRWRSLNPRAFLSLPTPGELLHLLDAPALGNATGIESRVFPNLGIDVHRINAAEGILGTFNLCNFAEKSIVSLPHQAVDAQHLIAGISLPILLPAVSIGGSTYVDAAWIKDANLLEAVDRGAEEIWLIWCIANTDRYLNGIVNQYVHMIEISANAGLFAEFAQIRSINERIRGGEAVGGRSAPIRLHVIRPLFPLPLDTDLYLGHVDHGALIDAGYADARRYLDSMRPEGLPFNPEVTQMQTAPAGIAFEETMSGPFSLGSTDPVEGERAGTESGTRMAMHASIHIRDLDGFLRDPEHRGEISGRIDFTPFGENLPASRGVFSLFSPGGQPGVQWMVYELAFDHDGKSYYMAGHKEIHRDSATDLWSDTTTLFTTLHDGADRNGPVVGAGILRLSTEELVKLLRTARVTGATSDAERARTLAAFGKFFAGSLWEKYGVTAEEAKTWWTRLIQRVRRLL